uniref:GPI inositol-deacylase n=1 Tax=Leersia perrieri TaxID=77586 RepID=A0A0D9XBS7_9ORYZ
MGGFGGSCRVAAVLVFTAWIALTAVNRLVRPVPNGCVMTYMYPTYIPISTPRNVSSDRYGIFLYHEGWKQIDFDEHVRNLNGVPVLFVPGNGGSYKQVRSLAAESFRAYQNGRLEPTFYREASSAFLVNELEGFSIPSRYGRMLDWFAVDLEGEHSAMDGRILEEHTEYVVYAIHRILDLYKESHVARSKGRVQSSDNLPSSVILVGHSMGGFVARAALVHPGLRKSAVDTVLTLSSPHQYPPIALQPSLGQFFSHVNEEWRNGYKTGLSRTGSAKLLNVVVVSVAGGIHDYQVRSKLASLDGIVPSTHGFMVGSSSMKNVWLSMDHQSILWCNQLVVQVAHTLLSMVDPLNGRPFLSPEKRVFVFAKMLQSAVPQSLSWVTPVSGVKSSNLITSGSKDASALQRKDSLSCPPSVQWTSDGLEKDLHIQLNSVTVLAMDGKRRWLDIKKLGSNCRGHFVFVTNLAPCSGVRIHLWPEKDHSSEQKEIPASKNIVEVTSKMVQIPAGPAPKQVEPGSQTEQPPPTAFLLLSPEEMSGFRFMTISVAPRPTISGRPPPAASMAVGQFFNPEEGTSAFTAARIIGSSYIPEEDHPLALNLSFSVSLGLLPVILSLRTAGCGVKPTGDQLEAEKNKLCKLRCFPPVALAWDPVSGLHIIPNIYSETLVVDSSPAFWDSHQGNERTTVLILADPHCSYEVSLRVSLSAAASRFFLLYSSQILGFMIAVMFFGLMRQSSAWEHDSSVPSILSAIESNLRLPRAFMFLCFIPVLLFLAFLVFTRGENPPFGTFLFITIMCYIVANGFTILLILSSKLIIYVAAILHVFIKRRWQSWEDGTQSTIIHNFLNLSFPFQSLKQLVLVYYFSHMPSMRTQPFAASFRSITQKKDLYKSLGDNIILLSENKQDGLEQLLPMDDSPTSVKSFTDSQLEVFDCRHGIMILHLLATLMFAPSLVAWLQRIGMGQNFPWFVDSVLCVGTIMHGIFGSPPNVSCISFKLPGRGGRDVGLSFLYLVAGYYSFVSSMALAPYSSLYALAIIGFICFASRIIETRGTTCYSGFFMNENGCAGGIIMSIECPEEVRQLIDPSASTSASDHVQTPRDLLLDAANPLSILG